MGDFSRCDDDSQFTPIILRVDTDSMRTVLMNMVLMNVVLMDMVQMNQDHYLGTILY